ncbi:MAG: Holliday junction resolvase RuvX [Candidatus Omnitrophica bacterium]|nr:Holliday junction resolvase RuvX [Candidatus Omnitrophota bacterium]
MRILALDVGEKNIGLAISDELGLTAQGRPSFRRKNPDEDMVLLAEIIRDSGVGEIVVGMPLNMDGSLGKQTQAIGRFLDDLKKHLSLPIKLWDERLTTLQAERIMLQGDLSRKKRKKKIDQLSAQLILQSYLDAQNVQKD